MKDAGETIGKYLKRMLNGKNKIAEVKALHF